MRMSKLLFRFVIFLLASVALRVCGEQSSAALELTGASGSITQIASAGSGTLVISQGAADTSGLSLASGVLFYANEPRSALRRLAHFEDYPAGAGRLYAFDGVFSGADFQPDFSGDATGPAGALGSLILDPLQGIVTESPLGSGKAAYLGGAGTQLALPETATPVSFVFRQGPRNETARQIARYRYSPLFLASLDLGSYVTPLVLSSVDFAVQRSAGATNAQTLTFALRDEQDSNDMSTFQLHSLVKIGADNAVSIADHGAAFAPAGLVVQPGVGYRLLIEADYDFATWSAVIVRLDNGSRTELARRRPLNIDGFTLSGWAIPGRLEIIHGAVASESNRAFADRFFVDNLRSATAERPAFPRARSFEEFDSGAGRLLIRTGSDVGTVVISPGAEIPESMRTAFVGSARLVGSGAALDWSLADPTQGVVATSPLGTGRAAFLGGAPTGLALPDEAASYIVSVRPGRAAETALDLSKATPALRRFEADFYLERADTEASAAASQTLAFSLLDARDENDPATMTPFARVRIEADDSVSLADSGANFSATEVTLASGVAYHLRIEVDYAASTWSASIRSRDGSVEHVLADARSLHTEDFVLSPWAPPGLFEVTMGATGSASARELPDRFYFDNLLVTDGVVTLDDFTPFFVLAPADKQLRPGAPHTFRAEAFGEPAPTYQWFRNGEVVPEATTSTLSVVTPAFGNDADYSVAATNSSGTAVRIADLTVLPPLAAPSFTDHPDAVIAAIGQTVSFAVSVAGNPAPALQWRRNGKAIPGATSATYAFTAAAARVGNYDVVATNSQGTATSQVATFALPVAPRITTQPRAQTVDAGAFVTFTVAAAGRPSDFTYTWMRDGQPIAGAPNAPAYTLPGPVTRAEAGRYSVSVGNGFGKPAVSAVARLVVRHAPEILAPLDDVTALAGEKVTLRVTAVATPAPAYQWRKNGQPITGARGASYSFTAGLARAGEYDVVVSNALGSVTSDTAVVVVNQPPKIVAAPAAAKRREGQTHTLSVTATGFPEVGYQWLKNGEEIPGKTAAQLTLSPLSLVDEAFYSVRITNSLGVSTTKPVKLQVSRAPYGASPQAAFRLNGEAYFIDGDYANINERHTFPSGKVNIYDFDDRTTEQAPAVFTRVSATRCRLTFDTMVEGVRVYCTYIYDFDTTKSGSFSVWVYASGYGTFASGSGTFTYSEPGL